MATMTSQVTWRKKCLPQTATVEDILAAIAEHGNVWVHGLGRLTVCTHNGVTGVGETAPQQHAILRFRPFNQAKRAARTFHINYKTALELEGGDTP